MQMHYTIYIYATTSYKRFILYMLYIYTHIYIQIHYTYIYKFIMHIYMYPHTQAGFYVGIRDKHWGVVLIIVVQICTHTCTLAQHVYTHNISIYTHITLIHTLHINIHSHYMHTYIIYQYLHKHRQRILCGTAQQRVWRTADGHSSQKHTHIYTHTHTHTHMHTQILCIRTFHTNIYPHHVHRGWILCRTAQQTVGRSAHQRLFRAGTTNSSFFCNPTHSYEYLHICMYAYLQSVVLIVMSPPPPL